MSCRRLVFDTGPLSSFAIADRLDLLEAVCAGHGSWPLSVQRELRAGVRLQPALVELLDASFLGVPEVLERPADLLEAELLRVRLAGSSLSQRHNRGEAEAIFLARRRHGVFVSEDRDARVLAAGGRGALTPTASRGEAWGGHADGASVGGAVWTSGPPLGGGRSRGSKG